MKVAIIAVFLSVSLVGGAQSQSRPKLKDVCKFDIEQYCKGFSKKQTKQIKECLAKQERNLLPYCQDRYKQAA